MAGAVSCFRMAAPPDPSSAKVAAGGIRSVRPRFLAGQPRGSAQALSFVAMDDLDHCDSCGDRAPDVVAVHRSEEHTSELQSLMRISYAVFCLKKKNKHCSQ